MSSKSSLKIHNAMWPGLVGKGDGPGQEPPISLEHMLELTAAASVRGQKFDGIDYFLFFPHTDPNASDAEFEPHRGLDRRALVFCGVVGCAGLARHRMGDSAMGKLSRRERNSYRPSASRAGSQECSTNMAYERAESFESIARNSESKNGDKIKRLIRKRLSIHSRKRQRSPKITVNDWPPKVKSVGLGCIAGKICLDVLEGVGMPESLGFSSGPCPHLSLFDGLQRS